MGVLHFGIMKALYEENCMLVWFLTTGIASILTA